MGGGQWEGGLRSQKTERQYCKHETQEKDKTPVLSSQHMKDTNNWEVCEEIKNIKMEHALACTCEPVDKNIYRIWMNSSLLKSRLWYW